MKQELLNNKHHLVKILAISCLVVALLFAWQGNKGFNLWDEGYLWYGVQRVLKNEVPILDFLAYDPGRYYWSAVLLTMMGDSGIMSLRGSVAIFQALGLFVGLMLVTRSTSSNGKLDGVFLLLAVVTLVMWMFPRHKLFDISLSICLLGVLTWLVKNPIPQRYFYAGVCVGFVAVFGRNHGVYGALGSMGVIAWLGIRTRSGPGFLKGILLWGGGVAMGFLPILLMAILIPGFAIAFWESVRLLFEQKATNLPLPVPWPWAVDFAGLPSGEVVRGILVGLFFLGTLAFGGFGMAWVVYQRLQERALPPALVAAGFLAIPYAHHAFSRADVGHLAQGIFPSMVGCLVLLSASQARMKWPLAAALCASSVWVMHIHHPGWQCLERDACVEVDISGSHLQVDSGTANAIALMRQLADQYAPNGQSFMVTPFWPGAYALLERRSPVWEIYALLPRPEAFEREEIERMKASGLGFVFIFDMALDGREELRFRNTHPLMYQFVQNNFERISNLQNPAYQIYKARTKEQ